MRESSSQCGPAARHQVARPVMRLFGRLSVTLLASDASRFFPPEHPGTARYHPNLAAQCQNRGVRRPRNDVSLRLRPGHKYVSQFLQPLCRIGRTPPFVAGGLVLRTQDGAPFYLKPLPGSACVQSTFDARTVAARTKRPEATPGSELDPNLQVIHSCDCPALTPPRRCTRVNSRHSIRNRCRRPWRAGCEIC